MKDVITQRRDRRGCGRVRVWVCSASATRTSSEIFSNFSCASATRLDHPITLGIGGIGYDIVSEGVHKVKPCAGRLIVGYAPGKERGHFSRSPDTSPETVVWEKERTLACTYIPGASVLECRFNKTTRYPCRESRETTPKF